jgi:hypothetical protein
LPLLLPSLCSPPIGIAETPLLLLLQQHEQLSKTPFVQKQN